MVEECNHYLDDVDMNHLCKITKVKTQEEADLVNRLKKSWIVSVEEWKALPDDKKYGCLLMARVTKSERDIVMDILERELPGYIKFNEALFSLTLDDFAD